METPVNAPFKEKVRLEFTKLREMTFKGKIEYIWDYYKIHILCTAISLIAIFSLLNTWIFNPNPDTVLFIAWNGGYATEEQLDRLKNHIEERLIEESANEEVAIAQFFFSSDDPSMNMAEVQRTVAMIAAGVIDLFITSHQLLEEQSHIGYLQPLDQVLAAIKLENPIVYSRIEENIVTALFETGENIVEQRPAGINIGNSPLFSSLGMFRQEIYVGVSVTSGQFNNIVQTLIMLFE